MSSVKKRWLVLTALVAALCISLGTVLMIRANAPVEPKTVYLMPKPNPARAEILKRALQPPKRAYPTTGAAFERATTGDTTAGSLEVDSDASSSRGSEFEDTDLELMLGILDEETVEEKGDFPPVPEGFPFTPVWLRIPDYTKGDQLGSEQIGRVLIKLWNQGDRAFEGGTIWHNNGQIYPIYPDVLYVEWEETTIENGDGNRIPVRYVTNSIGPFAPEFDAEDIAAGSFEAKYPDIKFIPFDQAGYDPYTFLTEHD